MPRPLSTSCSAGSAVPGRTLFEVYAVGESAALYERFSFRVDTGCMRMSALRPVRPVP
ncbi:hypothetical protein [Streptomyces sp. NPDC050988]|uniref:hypothetical protein n=1 Tax=Streptomyces sp. NPDC050988 TaxID=3365637 RepID=UPI0037B7F755